jgi:hypothetical protein
MSQLFREAVGDAQEQYDTLLMHLALIRDLTHCGQSAPTFEALATQLAECLVNGLGHERVLVLTGRPHEPLTVAGSYSQSERFGDTVDALPAALPALASEIMEQRAARASGSAGRCRTDSTDRSSGSRSSSGATVSARCSVFKSCRSSGTSSARARSSSSARSSARW